MAASGYICTLKILEEKNNIAFCEITKDNSNFQSKSRFYVVRIDHDKQLVFSVIPADYPWNGTWYGDISADVVSKVAMGRKRPTARKWFNAISKNNLIKDTAESTLEQ